MNGRLAAGGAAIAVILGVALFWFVTRPDGGGDTPETQRVKPGVEKVVEKPTPGGPAIGNVAKVQPTVRPAEQPGGIEVMELADQPEVQFDPMSSYPLNKQGMQGAFAEMQIEFDACRKEKGVAVDPKVEVVMTIRREAPPHEEYGTEPGEIFGMVKDVQVVGADPEAMKPFTACVQDNLYDLLFDPPTQEAVQITWPMTFN